MNRFMVGLALALLLAPADTAHGQTSARVVYRDGRLGVDVAIGNLPIRVRPRSAQVGGWVAADWGPVRVWVGAARPVYRRDVMTRKDLRHLLGKETVKRLERHARVLGLHGPIMGRWYQVDRYTALLEVEVRGAPVAELYDYGRDGYIDRILLTQPPRVGRYKEAPNLHRYPGGRGPG